MIHAVFDDQCLGTGAAQYQAQKSRLSIETEREQDTIPYPRYKGQLSQSSFSLVTYFSEI